MASTRKTAANTRASAEKVDEIPAWLAELPSRIRYARQASGLARTDFGAECGVRMLQVKRWEEGENYPPFTKFQRIADLGRVGFAWLLTGIGDPRAEYRAADRSSYDSLTAFFEERRGELSEIERRHLMSIDTGPHDLGKGYWEMVLNVFRVKQIESLHAPKRKRAEAKQPRKKPSSGQRAHLQG